MKQIIRKIYHYLRTEKTLAILPIARILFLMISFRAAAEPTFNGINKDSSLGHSHLHHAISLFHTHLNQYQAPCHQLIRRGLNELMPKSFSLFQCLAQHWSNTGIWYRCKWKIIHKLYDSYTTDSSVKLQWERNYCPTCITSQRTKQ